MKCPTCAALTYGSPNSAQRAPGRQPNLRRLPSASMCMRAAGCNIQAYCRPPSCSLLISVVALECSDGSPASAKLCPAVAAAQPCRCRRMRWRTNICTTPRRERHAAALARLWTSWCRASRSPKRTISPPCCGVQSRETPLLISSWEVPSSCMYVTASCIRLAD